jgi:hypothetical protein
LYCLQSKIAKRAIKITNHATKNLIRPWIMVSNSLFNNIQNKKKTA